jgi:uracil-DNA glycosylase
MVTAPPVPSPRAVASIAADRWADPLGAPTTHTHRAAQGVLLLNTALTVRAHTPNSHANQGWELLTDAAIRAVSRERQGVVFLLWGNAAKKKASLIDSTRHTVLTAAHPSGLSASRGFFGCKHFSKTNAALTSRSLEPIVWQLDA